MSMYLSDDAATRRAAAELERLQERVATLEGGIRAHRDTALGVDLFWSHDERLWSLLPEVTP